ncbi:DUF58 domain-containing protein [Thiocapsa bogorovii]|uniref:DUF58 domain-containing protein n=1 Tax=Thiocapsa bogorovii TaxID=521689 RepID=UPI001E2BC653|nr:DUF58 domain-containing protein [Thiocapsa bogorovii]UHD18444.1 DUF58 domain-containing protein [Thiocapsa bogorovii]
MVLALAGWTFVGLLAAWFLEARLAWQGIGTLLGALAAADLVALLGLPSPELRRQVQGILSLGTPGRVRLTLINPSARNLLLRLHDLHPSAFAVQGLPREIALGAGTSTTIDYRLTPSQRGSFAFPGCEIALRSPLGLWIDMRALTLSTRLRVYPNLARIARDNLPAMQDRRAVAGERVRPRRGEGAEFHQLRDYHRGDGLRRIDWKATARMRKLIAREYEDERGRHLVFLLDAGRRMRHCDAERSHLDEALSAVLAVAFVALAHGDAVGLMTYGGPRRWCAPRKQPQTMQRLLERVYDLEPSLDASDPLQAARELLHRMPRRTLVVMITNSRDEDQSGLERAARLLRRRHMLMIADLRESALDRSLNTAIKDLPDALRFHSVHGWLATRRRHLDRVRHLGVEILDLLPAQLSGALVAQYLAIKRAGRL